MSMSPTQDQIEALVGGARGEAVLMFNGVS